MTTRFADHILSGTHAARPAATAVPDGTIYACSDHNLIYQSDGATWATWIAAGAGASALNDLSDVDTTGQTSGDVLTYDGADWVPQAPAGGAAPSYLGYNTIGGTLESQTNNRQYMKQITVASNGILLSIDVYMQINATAQFSLNIVVLSDNAGVPDIMLAGVPSQANVGYAMLTTRPRWFSVPVGLRVVAGDYWIGFNGSSFTARDIYYDAGGDSTMDGATDPRDVTGALTVSAREYSLRALFLPTA